MKKLYKFTKKNGETFKKWCDRKEMIHTYFRDSILCVSEVMKNDTKN